MGIPTIIGHTAIDTIITREGARKQLGGPPIYAAQTAKLLDRKLIVVTKVGDDFHGRFMKELRLFDIQHFDIMIDGPRTTNFIIDYTLQKRKLSVNGVCRPFTGIIELESPILLMPIAGELNLIQLKGNASLAVDPQGFIRDIGKQGIISFKEWDFRKIASRLEVLKVSEDELKWVSKGSGIRDRIRYLSRKGVITTIVTRGEEGSYIMHEKKLFLIPSFTNTKSVDPTGAGDCFLTTYFLEQLRGESVEWCGALASACASALVETNGPSFIHTKSEIMNRSEQIFEKIKTLG
jgi:sugar/nucleoside kinase (ribokinase family)